jgi:uncharacterized protein YuzE
MRIEYDSEADALYIRLREGKPVDNTDVDEGITVDLDAQKQPIGIEILDVSRRFPPETLSSVTVENLVAAKRS